MAAILNSANLHSAILVFPLKLTHTCQDWFPLFAQKRKPWLIDCDSTWWWQPSWILPSWIQTLPSWIQTPCYLLSDSLKNKLTPFWLWLKLIQSDLIHSFWMNLKMAVILNSAIVDSDTLLYSLRFTQKHSLSTHYDSNYFNLTQSHSFWLNLMMAAILNSAILDSTILVSTILVCPLKLTHTWRLVPTQKKLHSFILTQLDDCSHLEICHPWIQPFCTKNTSLIHSVSTWWWQPSWILPCWIQTLPSWTQTPCYLLSDSLKNTLFPLWLWLKLIQSD